MKRRGQTWYKCKHYNTVIGISPLDVVFRVGVWGGHVSDIFLLENCGFLQYLLPGDIILAGFTVQDSAGLYCVEVTSIISKTISVCCALYNCCPSVA